MTDEADEELYQPRPRGDRRWWALAVIVAVVVAAAVLVGRDSDDGRRTAERTSVAPTSPVAPPAVSLTVVGVVDNPPAPLVRAVRAAFPKARLSATGIEITADPDPAHNYQFATPRRRITVVVGRPDGRPDIVRTDLNSVVVVRTVAGRRVAVTVQAVRGRVAVIDGDAATRLARDTRLVADP